MADKYPRRAEPVTNELNSIAPDPRRYESTKPSIHHTPRTANPMLDKFLGFLLGPNDPNLARGEVPFLPPAVRMFRAGQTVSRMSPEVMEATHAANKAQDLEKIMERYQAEVVRPHDLPTGNITEVAPKIMEIGPPAGVTPTMGTSLEEMFRKLAFGRSYGR